MLPIRKEVQAFVRLSETLLSPVLLDGPLNEDERGLVAMYIQNLAEKYTEMEGTVSPESQRNIELRTVRANLEKQAALQESHHLVGLSRLVMDKSRASVEQSREDVGHVRECIDKSRSL
jgi:hypothetical protein